MASIFTEFDGRVKRFGPNKLPFFWDFSKQRYVKRCVIAVVDGGEVISTELLCELFGDMWEPTPPPHWSTRIYPLENLCQSHAIISNINFEIVPEGAMLPRIYLDQAIELAGISNDER